MSRLSRPFSIDDDDGQAHAYAITPHPGGEGFALATRLFGLFGGPLGGLLDAVDLAKPGKGSILDQSIEFGGLARGLAEAIAGCESVDLAKRLLSHTLRDDADLGGTKAAAEFDRIYEANYGELADAIFASVEVNRFATFFVRAAKKAAGMLPGIVLSDPKTDDE